MKAVRVTEEWQRAGVHYVRTQAMCLGFKIPLEGEFSDDTPEDEYILVMDGIYPVSTCRLHYLDEHTGKLSAWQHWNPIGENITDRQESLRRKTGCAKKV